MPWKLEISKDADKFLAKNKITVREIKKLANRAICYFQGEDINVNIKKLKGEWKGFYRIRGGKMRIIAEFDFENSVVFIEQIDWRGGVYK